MWFFFLEKYCHSTHPHLMLQDFQKLTQGVKQTAENCIGSDHCIFLVMQLMTGIDCGTLLALQITMEKFADCM